MAKVKGRSGLADAARTMYDREIASRRSVIDQHERQIIVYRDSITDYMGMIRTEQRLLDAMTALTEDNGASSMMLAEFDKLAEHPRIEELTFAANTVKILTTRDIRLHHPTTGETRWLGQFQINFGLNRRVTIRNLSTPMGGRDHPHVVDQRPCFGGHDAAFDQLLARGELHTLFELTLQYLETLNLRDEWGRYGAWWFDRPDQEPKPEAEAEATAEAEAASPQARRRAAREEVTA